MDYINGFLSIFLAVTNYLIDHDVKFFVVLIISGLASGVLLWFLCTYFGRLFYKPYRLNVGQHIFCGFSAFILMLLAPTYIAAGYLSPTIIAVVDHWRDALVNDKPWLNQQFVRQYHEVKHMNIEDFSKSPPPEQGGNSIPMNHVESRIKTSQMTATAAMENFNISFPLLSSIIRAGDVVPATAVIDDVTNYFKAHPGTSYPHIRGVQLAADQIHKELIPQIPRIIFTIRLSLILFIIILYVIGLGWIAFDALRKIRIYSAHSSVRPS